MWENKSVSVGAVLYLCVPWLPCLEYCEASIFRLCDESTSFTLKTSVNAKWHGTRFSRSFLLGGDLS